MKILIPMCFLKDKLRAHFVQKWCWVINRNLLSHSSHSFVGPKYREFQEICCGREGRNRRPPSMFELMMQCKYFYWNFLISTTYSSIQITGVYSVFHAFMQVSNSSVNVPIIERYGYNSLHICINAFCNFSWKNSSIAISCDKIRHFFLKWGVPTYYASMS